jgi:glycine/D-amino acid oxidase-like deaminating enzyme
MRRTTDAIVIGAGIMGGAIAFELAKSGRGVIIVDKAGAPGHGSTSSSSAIVRFNYSTYDGVAMSWEAKHCWTAWPEHLGGGAGPLASFRRTGMIVLDTPIIARERTAQLLDRVGVPYEEWDAEALRAHVPGIDAGAYWPPKSIDDDAFFHDAPDELGALYMPDAGFIDDPQLAAQNLVDAARRLGGDVLLNRRVTEITRRDDRVSGLALDDGSTLESTVVVNAAGPWSGRLNEMAGVGRDFTIGVRPLRQEVHSLRAPSGFNAEDALGPSIADMDLGTYMRPAPGDRLLVGGTEPACDALEWVSDPDDANPSVTSTSFARQITRAARRLSTLTVPTKAQGVAGVYDVSDDWTPIYDRTELDGYYVAMGTSGNQFKNAPLVGRLLVTLIDRVEGGHDHDGDPMRYRGEHTNNVINLGAFSRRRVRNADSSGTVLG